MFDTVGCAVCTGVDVDDDPWVPLDVSWHLGKRSNTLYLMVTGLDGGYVELKIDSSDGALVEVVVIDEPPGGVGYDVLPDASNASCVTPLISMERWSEAVVSGYTASNSIVRISSKLRFSVTGSIATLIFSELSVGEFIGAGPARLGLSPNKQLVCVVAAKGERFMV